MNYEKQCRICGKDIVVINSRYCLCGSEECAKKNTKRLHEEYYSRIKNDKFLYQKYRNQGLDSQRRRYNPVLCMICGKQMVRDYEAHDTHRNRMHTECIVKDAIETIKSGSKLTTKQWTRLYGRGYDVSMIKEMIETGEIY